MSAARRLGALALLLLALLGVARAHTQVPTRATLILRADRFDLRVETGWHTLSAGSTDPDAADRFLTAQLALTGPARAAWLGRVGAFFDASVTLSCDGVGVPLRFELPGLVEPASTSADLPAEAVAGPQAEARGPLPPGAARCRLAPALVLGPVTLAVRRPDANADGPAPAEDRRLLPAGEPSPDYALRPGPEASNGAGSAAPPEPGVLDFVRVGFEHILPGGLDHVLFVLGLFFLGAGLRPLLVQVTAFTVAHSVTLALGLLGVLALPAAVVEPAIAASIAFVAVENLWARRDGPGLLRRRAALVFGFGLIHGLGFARALSEAELPPGRLSATLIGFNLGVECGQLATIAGAAALMVPLARALGEDRAEAYLRRPACLGIAATGLFWFVERLAAA